MLPSPTGPSVMPTSRGRAGKVAHSVAFDLKRLSISQRSLLVYSIELNSDPNLAATYHDWCPGSALSEGKLDGR